MNKEGFAIAIALEEVINFRDCRIINFKLKWLMVEIKSDS